MKALISKEMDSAQPYFWAVVVLLFTDIVHLVFFHPLEASPSVQLEVDASGWLILGGALIFWASHASIDRELRGEHFEFLDGLPTSRAHIFAAKLVSMGLLVAAVSAAFFLRGAIWWSTFTTNDAPSIAPTAVWLLPRFTLALAALGSLGLVTGWLGSTGLVLALFSLFVVEVAATLSPGWQRVALSSLVHRRPDDIKVSLPFGPQVAPRPSAALPGFSVTGAHPAPSEAARPATQIAADLIDGIWTAVH